MHTFLVPFKKEEREGKVGRWEGGRIMSTNRGKCDIMEKI